MTKIDARSVEARRTEVKMNKGDAEDAWRRGEEDRHMIIKSEYPEDG